MIAEEHRKGGDLPMGVDAEESLSDSMS